MFAPVSRETGDAATRRLLVFILIALPVAVLAARSAQDTAGLNNQGPDGLPETTCATGNYTEIFLSPPPPVSIGKYYTTEEISIEAVGQAHVSTSSGPNQPCIPMVADITDAVWQLISKPSGSSATVQTSGIFRGRFTPDIDGTYIVRWVVCPLTCQLFFPGVSPVVVESAERQLTFETASDLPFPPQIDPVPYDPCISSSCDTQSDFPPDVRNFKCNDGGGVVDPQWVTVGNWQNVFDYELLEGVVQKARVSRKDSPMNHYSQDFNFKVLADPQYLDLVSTDPEDAPHPESMGVEWENDYYPERFRPAVRDRVSVWGYWIHDCGHEPFFTEIHPPVGVATHRARPVHLPESLGLGTNVYSPGVVSDVWFNGDAGEITDNCSWTGLHLPGNTSGDACLPKKTGGPNPIAGRGYEYNIYLPPSPEDTLRAAGHDNPPEVELYYEAVDFPAGREPNIFVIETDDLTYLHVELDLVGYTENTFSGRIVAAWQYPSPDNWGLRAFEFEVSSIDVHGDSDVTCNDFYCPVIFGGDPRMWVSIPNVNKEWTRIISCDECVYDESTHRFGGRPWRTSSNDAGRDLGEDVLLFPEQLFTVSFSGYEDDWLETSDDAGFIQQVLPPPKEGSLTGWPNNVCSDSSPEIEIPVAGTDIAASHCMDYNVNWRLSPLGPINASLSQAGQALYNASLVNVADLNNCDSLIQIVCWDNRAAILDFAEIVPAGTHPPGPIKEEDFGAFKPQSIEDFTYADIHPQLLKLEILNATQAQLDQFFAEFKQELGAHHDDHPGWEFVVLEAAIGPDLWDEHFGDLDVLWPVWGDGDCDEDVDEMDVLRSLMVSARVKPGAPCLLQTDANCDTVYDVEDTMLLLRFVAGFDVAGASGSQGEDGVCTAIGEEVHLELDLPPTTATPTPGPSFTPTPTPTATATVAPTPTPSPTPDTTGPTITNVTDNPDPIDDDPGCGNPAVSTISANVDDPSGLDSVVLHLRIVDDGEPGPWFTTNASFNNGTGKWEVQVDPTMQNAVTGFVQWYWEATDNNANTTIEPANAPTSFYDTTVLYCD